MHNSERLNLPYIQPAQAQKHVTHNEAIELLDKLVHMAVDDALQSPPDEALDLDTMVLVDIDASGAFEGRDNSIAVYQGAGWAFLTPQDGWMVYNKARGHFISFSDGRWKPVQAEIDAVPYLGINATADDFNRLVARGPSTLLTAQEGSHRLAINKSAIDDTASCVFQSDYQAHAEIGLTGDNALSLKVLDNGGVWKTSLRVDTVSGRPLFPLGSPDIPEPNVLRNSNFTIWQRGLSHQLSFPLLTADGWRIGRRSGGPLETTAARHVSGQGVQISMSGLSQNKRHLTVCQINVGDDISDIASKGVATFAIDAEVSEGALDGTFVLSLQTSKNQMAKPWSAGLLDDADVDRAMMNNFTIKQEASRYAITLTNIAPDTQLVLCSFIYVPPEVTDSSSDQIVLHRAKLEASSFATRYVKRPQSLELSECQRFFLKSAIQLNTADLALKMRTEPVETFDDAYVYDSDL